MTRKSTSDPTLKDRNGRTEEEFLLSYDPDRYPKPSLTADICIFSEEGILLVRRRNHPYLYHWALPGGFANANEPLEKTAERELTEETGISASGMRLVGIYSAPNRDPRGWVVSAAFAKEIPARDVSPKAGDDAMDTRWFRIVSEDPLRLESGDICLQEEDLAFDHAVIIQDALKRSGGLK